MRVSHPCCKVNYTWHGVLFSLSLSLPTTPTPLSPQPALLPRHQNPDSSNDPSRIHAVTSTLKYRARLMSRHVLYVLEVEIVLRVPQETWRDNPTPAQRHLHPIIGSATNLNKHRHWPYTTTSSAIQIQYSDQQASLSDLPYNDNQVCMVFRHDFLDLINSFFTPPTDADRPR